MLIIYFLIDLFGSSLMTASFFCPPLLGLWVGSSRSLVSYLALQTPGSLELCCCWGAMGIHNRGGTALSCFSYCSFLNVVHVVLYSPSPSIQHLCGPVGSTALLHSMPLPGPTQSAHVYCDPIHSYRITITIIPIGNYTWYGLQWSCKLYA